MLYASTRATLTKSLGSASFPDALFATHKSDLTATAYAAHRRHQTAPKPLSTREQEMADVQAAERAAARSGNDGSIVGRHQFGGAGVKMNWSEDVEQVVKALSSGGEGSRLVVMTIDPATETLVLISNEECEPNDLCALLPSSDPCEHSIMTRIIFVVSDTKQHMRFTYGRTHNGETSVSDHPHGLSFQLTYSSVHILLSRYICHQTPHDIFFKCLFRPYSRKRVGCSRGKEN